MNNHIGIKNTIMFSHNSVLKVNNFKYVKWKKNAQFQKEFKTQCIYKFNKKDKVELISTQLIISIKESLLNKNLDHHYNYNTLYNYNFEIRYRKKKYNTTITIIDKVYEYRNQLNKLIEFIYNIYNLNLNIISYNNELIIEILF